RASLAQADRHAQIRAAIVGGVEILVEAEVERPATAKAAVPVRAGVARRVLVGVLQAQVGAAEAAECLRVPAEQRAFADPGGILAEARGDVAVLAMGARAVEGNREARVGPAVAKR